MSPEKGKFRRAVDFLDRHTEIDSTPILDAVDTGVDKMKKFFQLVGSLKNPFSKKYKGLDFVDIANAHLDRIGNLRKALRLLPLAFTKPITYLADASMHAAGSVVKTVGKVAGGSIKYPKLYVKGVLKKAGETVFTKAADKSDGNAWVRAMKMFGRIATLPLSPLVNKEYGGVAPTFMGRRKSEWAKAVQKGKGFIPSAMQGMTKNKDNKTHAEKRKEKGEASYKKHVAAGRKALKKSKARKGPAGSKASKDTQKQLDEMMKDAA